MRRFLLTFFCLLVICGSVFYFLSVPRGRSDILADRGVIDLRGADFDHLYALGGEWEFYWNRLYTPEDFSDGTPEGRALIPVPSSWHEAGYPLYGCATYRLTLLTDEPEAAIFIPEISDSSVVYVGGKRVFAAGTPGRSAVETVPSMRNSAQRVSPDEDGRVEIVVQAANFGWFASGLRYHFEFGRPGLLFNDFLGRRVMLGAFIGLLLTMALYHIMLFALRHEEKVYLMFALACLVTALRFFTETNSLADIFMPNGIDYFMTYVFLAAIVLQSAALTYFTYAVFRLRLKKITQITHAATLALPFLIYVCLPYGTISARWSYISLLPMASAVVRAAASRVAVIRRVRESPYNILYLFILAFMVFWYPAQKILLTNSLFIPGAATNLFLVLCQCLVLSTSYAEARLREERLQRKTAFYRRMSHDLRTPLTVVSTSVQVARIAPEEADRLLAQSQAEIMRMADMIDRALEEGENV